MSYIKHVMQDLGAALAAAADKWAERRHLRAGGNPDFMPVEAVRAWKRRAALRQRRASLRDDPSIPF